jgi:alpha 1,6-mannosyltransferase
VPEGEAPVVSYKLHYTNKTPEFEFKDSWKYDNNKHIIFNYWSEEDMDRYIVKERASLKDSLKYMLPVEKADFFRYLVVSVEGGIWSDVDCESYTPLDMWLANSGFGKYNLRTLDFVIGVERPEIITEYKFEIPFQLCQWVFTGCPGSFLFTKVADEIEVILRNNKQLSTSSVDVLQKTGPGIFTKIILEVLSRYSRDPVQPLSVLNTTGQVFNLKLENGKEVQGIILPTISFASRFAIVEQNKQVLARHHFAGSWRLEKPT